MSKSKKQNSMVKKNGGRVENTPITLDVLDSVVEIADEARQLYQALECANTAMQTEFNDPMDYMEGMVAVLLLASDTLAAKSSVLQCKLYDMLDQEMAC